MTIPKLKIEPYEISPRFYCALREKALSLEASADQDQLIAVSIEHPGHLRRQNLLVQEQRDEAKRLLDFLASTRIRINK